MALVIQTWTFDGNPSSSQGWTPVLGTLAAGSGTPQETSTWTTVDGSPASGCLEFSIPTGAKSVTATQSYWELTGTWMGLLGIPAGSVVTSIQSNSYNWAIYQNVVGGAASTTGPFELWSGSAPGTVAFAATLSSGSGAGSTHAAWASIAGVAVNIPASLQDAKSFVRLRLNNSLATGNSVADTITMHQDQISISVVYTPPITGSAINTIGGQLPLNIKNIGAGASVASIRIIGI